MRNFLVPRRVRKLDRKHQPVSEGISWEPCIVSSHTAPQKIAKKISFQLTENDMMVENKFSHKKGLKLRPAPSQFCSMFQHSKDRVISDATINPGQNAHIEKSHHHLE